MLVLKRSEGEVIRIGDNIRIAVVRIGGEGSTGKVRLGITAPRGVPVHREEVWKAIQAERVRSRDDHPRRHPSFPARERG